MKKFKLSTKLLAGLSLGLTYFFSWLLDPQNLAAAQTLLRGHARLLSLLGMAVTLYNLQHQPAQNASVVPVKSDPPATP